MDPQQTAKVVDGIATWYKAEKLCAG